jgi:hypothetical protein
MQTRTTTTADDRTCSLTFLLIAAFASGLVWVTMMMGHLTVR